MLDLPRAFISSCVFIYIYVSMDKWVNIIFRPISVSCEGVRFEINHLHSGKHAIPQ